MMNSRIYSVIYYMFFLITFTGVVYWLYKYERHKIPLGRIQSITKYIEEDYVNRASLKKYDTTKEEVNYSNLSICINIVSVCGSGDSDFFAEQLKEHANKQIRSKLIKNQKKDNKRIPLSDIKDFFIVEVKLIDRKTVNNKALNIETLEKDKLICEKLYAKNKPKEFLDNSYYIFVNENEEAKKEVLSFTVSTTNIIEIHFNKEKENGDYNKYISESWHLITNVFLGKTKHKQLEFLPELDLNFYLANSLYNEKNYKIEIGRVDSFAKENKVEEKNEKNKKSENGNKEMKNSERENNEKIDYKNENGKHNSLYKQQKIPVVMATWNFYDDFYYPYMRAFIERLLHIFHINIYSETIGNINLFKITEKAEHVLKEETIKKLNLKENSRLLILDKVTKFTDVFDDATFGSMLNKPTYKVPQNINLISIFPSEEDIYFYNNLSETIETTASFVEWGIIHINNLFTTYEKFKKKKEKVINISNDVAYIMNGLFISHLRNFLGFCFNFDKFIYTIYDSTKYKIKFQSAVSKDNENFIIFNVTNDSNFRFSFIQNIPIKHGITDYELLILIREAYSTRIVQTFENLNKFIKISSMSIYIKVPEYSVEVFNNILNNIECSLSYMKGEDCVHKDVKNGVIEKFQNLLKDGKYTKEIYFKVALVLAQAAYQDSLQLLHDERITIYEIFSKDFLLAALVPIALPFILPVTFALFKEFLKHLSKQKVKMD